jgi:hypothetical protein
MISYLHSGVLDEYDVIEFAAYEYGTDTTTQLLTWAHAGLLIRSTFVSKGFLLHADDRYFYKDPVVFPNDVARVSLVTVSREDHEPLVHHYSFARGSQTNLKRKVLLSGHFDDANPTTAHLGIQGLFPDADLTNALLAVPVDRTATEDSIVFAGSSQQARRVVKSFVLS